MFWGNMLPPSSRLRVNIVWNKHEAGSTVSFMLALFLNPEDGRNIYLQNVS
jgi:hypothetical protein